MATNSKGKGIVGLKVYAGNSHDLFLDKEGTALLSGDCSKYLFIENIYTVAINLGMAITNLAAGKYADICQLLTGQLLACQLLTCQLPTCQLTWQGQT